MTTHAAVRDRGAVFFMEDDKDKDKDKDKKRGPDMERTQSSPENARTGGRADAARK